MLLAEAAEAGSETAAAALARELRLGGDLQVQVEPRRVVPLTR
jgi:hypothetical protein